MECVASVPKKRETVSHVIMLSSFEHTHLQVNDRRLSCLVLLIVDLRVKGGPWVRVWVIRLAIRMAIRTAMKNVRLRSPDLRRIARGENIG